MKKLDLRYGLTYEEAYEAFRSLASRRGRASRIWVSVVLVMIVVSFLVLYARNEFGIHYLFMAVCSIAILSYLVYQPALAARKGEANVARAKGEYRIVLHEDGKIDLAGSESIDFRGDRFARCVETENVFAMRPDAMHTICIPKRVLKDKDEKFIREHFM